jgi:hypothetical protein
MPKAKKEVRFWTDAEWVDKLQGHLKRVRAPSLTAWVKAACEEKMEREGGK